MMIKRNQAASTKRPSPRKKTGWWSVALLLVVLAAASAWWFLRSRSQLLTNSANAETVQLAGDNNDQQQSDRERVVYRRHRDRSVDADLTDTEYREKMLALDKSMIQKHRSKMEDMQEKHTLKERRDTYAIRREELRGLIVAHGKGKRDKDPRSVVNDAIRQLKELEEDASY